MLWLVVGGRSTGEGRCDWALPVFQWLSLGCFAFSNGVTPSKRWDMFRGQEKQLRWLNAEYIHLLLLITCIWLYLLFLFYAPPLAQDTGWAWSTTVLTALFATCHFCPAKHLLHEAYGHAWIMSYLGRNSRSCGRCLSSGKISQPPTAHGRINLGICMELH